MSSPFGKNIKLYIDGGAHDEEIVMRLSGFPAGLVLDEAALLAFLDRRRPANAWETPRRETDIPVFESGVVNGVTDGSEIRAVVKNENADPSAYADVNRLPRPSHADYPAVMKYGKNVDLRGGGHFSGRLTVLTCTAGYVAMQYLKKYGAEVFAHIASIQNVCDAPFDPTAPVKCEKPFPVFDDAAAAAMKAAMLKAKEDGDSLGGIVECAVTGLPAGLGEHMFASVEASIADAVFSVPAVKGISFGAGFRGTVLTGSEHNDRYYCENGKIKTYTNSNGGILGGMTTGMPVIFSAAIKPTPSIAKQQMTVDLATGKSVKLTVNGRHDACIVPRAVPVIEAAAALAVADILLGEEKAEDLPALRRMIDRTDEQLLAILCGRMELSEAVAEEKAKTGRPVYDPEREARLLERIETLAGENAAPAREIYEVILKYSKKIQKEIIERKR